MEGAIFFPVLPLGLAELLWGRGEQKNFKSTLEVSVGSHRSCFPI